MSKTKDGVKYNRGMTLFSVTPNLGGPFVSEHAKTYQNGEGRWQTDGSPGCHGVIADCYSTERAAIKSIIWSYDTMIHSLTEQRKTWQGKLK